MSEQENKLLDQAVEVDHGKEFFSWRFSEFDRHQRGTDWYVWATVGMVLLLLYAFVTQNILFALVIIMGAMIFYFFQRNNSEIDFKITEDGIFVDEKFYEYDKILSFYIIYQPPEVKKLFFELKGLLSPRIPVDLVDQDPVKVREVLLRHLDEDLEKEHEPTSEQFRRMFKL